MDFLTILTPEMRQLLRQRCNEVVDAAIGRYRSSIVAVYGAKENGRPIHIGSAIFLEVNGRKVCLTAAHVVDENNFTTLYLAVGTELERLEAQFTITAAPLGRHKDHVDFAFCALPADLASKFTGRFAATTEIANDGWDDKGRYYTALGYPYSKNRKYNPTKNSVTLQLFPYSNAHLVDDAIASNLPGKGVGHLFLPWSKKSRDEAGAIANTTYPRGMSGGAVIDAGRPGALSVFRGEAVPEPRLAGLIIELKKKKVLLALRLTVVLPFLLNAFPPVASEISSDEADRS